MLVVDDLLVKPFVSLLGIIHAMALDELFDVGEIEDQLKENRLLYEIGERPEPEYRRRKRELENQRKLAEQVREQIQNRVEVKGR